jgi:isoquinoline 1-oxidoreductase beta subunit
MASPFGSGVGTIAEVSVRDGAVVVHDVWVAIDPGSIVDPAVTEAQVNPAVVLGLSSAMLEEVVHADGMPQARHFDVYPILPPGRMPRVHVRIVESGAPPAMVDAASVLTGQRVRSLPLPKLDLKGMAGKPLQG